MTTDEFMAAMRTIAATPVDVFAVLADPARHRETEPGDWVRDAVAPQPITGVGQVFAINMFHPASPGDGHYVMHNVVTEFDQDRVIAWRPGQLDESGQVRTGGWLWRYELAAPNIAPSGSPRTEVTLTYDWSHTPDPVRREIGGLPPFEPGFLDESLASLERAVTQ